MLDPPSIDEDNEEYFYNLAAASPDKDELIKTISEGLWYCTLLVAKTTHLDDNEKILLLNKNHVDWAKLNVDFLMFVAVNRDTSKVDADNCSKRLSTAKLGLLDTFPKAYDPQSVQGDRNHTMQ